MKRTQRLQNKRADLRRKMAENTFDQAAPGLVDSVSPTLDSQRVRQADTQSSGKTNVIVFRKTPLWKRLIDIAMSITLIIALSPLLLMTAIYIRFVSGKPILYIQERVGAGGKAFRMYKFRTMKISKDVDRDQEHRLYVASLAKSNAVLEKPDHASQYIPGGTFMRSSSIDELPQLFNVLKGQMSLVGPRPDLMQLEDYEIEHLRRFEVLPGITGLWQVNDKNDLSFGEMIDLDIHYVDHRSPLLDMKILLRTAATMVGNSNS